MTAQNCTKSGVVVFVKKLQKFANTVDPDPDRTAEEDYQQRLIKSGGYRLLQGLGRRPPLGNTQCNLLQ